MALQYSRQIYVWSLSPNGSLNSNGNTFTVSLKEPLILKENQYLQVSVVDAEINRTASWTTSPLFVYVISKALATTNQCQATNAVLAKVPVTAPVGYIIQWANMYTYKAPSYGRNVSTIDISIVNPDMTDVVFGSGSSAQWSVTLQLDIYDRSDKTFS